ncbi:unnamed protein product [Caenorhabditis brenneri]
MTTVPMGPSELPGVSENSEKSLPKKKKRSLVFPLEYWKTDPHWRLIEAEIDEAIWLTARESDMEYERKRIERMRTLEREKLEEKNKKREEEEGVKVTEIKNSKPDESEESKKAKLEKLKASRQRFYEKKRQEKLREDARRKKEREELLRKYENGEL